MTGSAGQSGRPPAGGSAGQGGGAAAGTTTPDVTPTLTAEEWTIVRTLSPLPPLPPDTTNKYADHPGAAALGQRLFFDPSYSGPVPSLGVLASGKISCASCHYGPGLDGHVPPLTLPGLPGMGGGYGSPGSTGRDTLGLINSSYYGWVGWGGRFSAQWELPLAVAEKPTAMASDRLTVVHLLMANYRSDYEAVFGALDPAIATDFSRFPLSGKPKASSLDPDGPWELMTAGDQWTINTAFVNYGKALEAYLRRLVSPSSRFDRFVAGDASALSTTEVTGLKAFVRQDRGCMQCHAGPFFSDGEFFVVTKDGGGRSDDLPLLLASPFNSVGVFSDDRTTGPLSELLATEPPLTPPGEFRTPTLRNVTLTQPYMHNGSAASLVDAINAHVAWPISLDGQDAAAVAAFLTSLNSDPLSPSLFNPVPF